MHALSSRGLRRPALLTGLLVSALALAGCGSSSEAESPATTPAATTDSTGAFPVTITSALGDAVIDAAPERVITLGQGSAETAIALGVTPVGMEEYSWGADETGYLPWVHEAVEASGDELPVLFTGGTEIDVDAILELEPDLILAPWSGLTQDQFDILTDIAPTVAYPDLPWSINWDEQITTIATALGQPEQADVLIDGIEDAFTAAAAAHPEYADVTFSYVYTVGPGSLGIFLPDEQRVAMVRGLGLTVDPVVSTFTETEGTDSALIGLENADKLSGSDLVFTFYSDDATRTEIEAQPLYQAIPAISRGSIVAPTDQSFVTGASMINPLTVPWALDRFVPIIDDAIATLGR